MNPLAAKMASKTVAKKTGAKKTAAKMRTKVSPTAAVRAAPAAPVCEVDVIHEETVLQIKPQLDRLQGLAKFFKALADDTRLKVIYALSQAELCVCDVAALIDGTKATASYHLRLLYNMGLADYRREGKLVYYRLTDEDLGKLVQDLVQKECPGAADIPERKVSTWPAVHEPRTV